MNTQDDHSQGQTKPHSLRPSFTLIEKRDGEEVSTYFVSPEDEKKQEEKKRKAHSSVRFLCFLGFIYCSIFGIGMFIWATLMTGMAVFFLFQNRPLNHSLLKVWKIVWKTSLAWLGFTVGLISPFLGLTFLAFTFSLGKNNTIQNFLNHFIRQVFS